MDKVPPEVGTSTEEERPASVDVGTTYSAASSVDAAINVNITPETADKAVMAIASQSDATTMAVPPPPPTLSAGCMASPQLAKAARAEAKKKEKHGHSKQCVVQ